MKIVTWGPSILLALGMGACMPGSTTTIQHGPYLALGGDSTMTVVWTTDFPADGTVEYGEEDSVQRTVRDSSLATRHEVKLIGLLPGTRYFYKVRSGGSTSPIASFFTMPQNGRRFQFVMYGDTRSNHEAHAQVLRSMEGFSPLFLVNTGDLVFANMKENWDAFFHDLCDSSSIGRTAPYYASPGNHETGPMYYEEEVLPRNNPDSTEQYYSFDVGGVHLLSLNTEIDFGPGSKQYRWLLDDFASRACKDAKFRIAFWHRPPYSTGNHGSDLHVRSVLCPLMESHGVNLVFTGHDHCYERTTSIGGTTYIVTGGGGAPLYDFRADSAWVAYKEKAYHFCLLSAEGDTLRVRMIRASDRTVGDSLMVIRNRGR